MDRERVIVLALLASAQAVSGGTTAKQAYGKAFDRSFRTSFRTSSVAGCIDRAKAAEAVHVDVTAVCGCVADRLLATKSVTQLRQPFDPKELRPMVAECVRSHPPQTGASAP